MNSLVTRVLARKFNEAGYTFYVVGGTVRDNLLGRGPSGDVDATTNAHPEEIKKILRSGASALYTIGEKFGTIGAKYSNGLGRTVDLEVTTYRADRYEAGNRKPEVAFGTRLVDDLSRRDFTINAIAQDPLPA